jgi:hypothetical protein
MAKIKKTLHGEMRTTEKIKQRRAVSPKTAAMKNVIQKSVSKKLQSSEQIKSLEDDEITAQVPIVPGTPVAAREAAESIFFMAAVEDMFCCMERSGVRNVEHICFFTEEECKQHIFLEHGIEV